MSCPTAMASQDVEKVAAALVREYLSRRGLKMTLEVMDEEEPRGESSISNRNALMKALHIEKLMKKNKDSDAPFKSMLEVMTNHFIEKSGNTGKPNDLLDSRPYSSVSSQGRTRGSAPGRKNELVLEDTLDGETVLGEGRLGTSSVVSEMKPSINRSAQAGTSASPSTNSGKPHPQSAAKLRGMSGPIHSNLENKDNLRRNRPGEKASLNVDWLKSDTDGKKTKNIILTPHKETDSLFPKGCNNAIRDLSEKKRGDTPPSGRSSRSDSSGSASSYNKRSENSKDSKDVLTGLDRDSWKPSSARRNRTVEDPEVFNVKQSSMNASSAEKVSGSSRSKTTSTSKVGDVEIGDLEDELDDLALASPVLPAKLPKSLMTTVKGVPIDLNTATDLKKLIFGSGDQCFPREWSHQGLSFCEHHGLKFGIVQKKGGPCGVLAAVQACMLQNLLYNGTKPDKRLLNTSGRERSEALAKGLSQIFWRASDSSTTLMALPSRTKHISSSTWFKEDNITETLMLYTFRKFEDLLSFVIENISQFETDGGCGVVLTIYSAILSRGIRKVQSDMDEPTGKLMGLHGYCTQNMVNLLLVGQAVSNVFNDTMELDTGGDYPTILKGIPARSDIGFLSLFEHYKSCQVGTYLKTPKYPIWVVCSESHFSVLFCLRRDLISDWKAEKIFDLYYYDGLARQDQEIRLTINSNVKYRRAADGELVPPLEHCIRTKWKDAVVDWNDTEPLL